MTEKPILREQVCAEIAALSDDYVSKSDEGIFHNAVALKEFQDARIIMVYYSVGREPDTLRISQYALDMGKTLAFPFCYKGGIMLARKVAGLHELKPAMLGIPAPSPEAGVIAPEMLDLVLVPALAYDRLGYRLGYGGGYYDRYLKGLRAFTAGISRARLVRDILPRETHDVAVNCLITEKYALRPPIPQEPQRS